MKFKRARKRPSSWESTTAQEFDFSFGTMGESPEKSACVRVCALTWTRRKLQSRASPQNRAKVIRSPFW